MDPSEGLDNSAFSPVRSRALSDLLASPTERHSTGLPVLEPIKIRSTENAEDESSESDPEDEEAEIVNDSDSEPEADREIKRTGHHHGSSDGRNFRFVVYCEP